jgi:hypothetical protein
MKTNQNRVASTFNVRGSMFNVLTLLLLALTGSASAATRYVWQDSPSPGLPYTNWTSAAHVIQDAVDAAQSGDTVLVAGGVYATGGRAVGTNLLVNRAAIDRAITVESLMGPEVTIIQGHQVPGTTNGDGAIRCVYLTSGASLSGFTLTNGATRQWRWPEDIDDRKESGGGLWCESASAVVSNCVVVGNSAYWDGGGAYSGTLNNCTLIGNSAGCEGGGAFEGTLDNCKLTANSALNDGGGACNARLKNCTLTGNSAGNCGGGAALATLNNCTLTGNSADNGGGGAGIRCTLNNCTLTGNSASNWGGGAAWSTLNNCTLNSNSAQYGGGASSGDGPEISVLNNCTLTGNLAFYGGGANWAWLNNCTLARNSASDSGGGAYGGTLNNSILYFNAATHGANYYTDEYHPLNYCCTTPMPTNGFGNITNAPLFVDYAGGNLRLQSNSPCINAGNNSSLTNYYYFTNLFDLDGLPRIVRGTVDIGAYEYQGSGSLISYAWLQQYGWPTDGSADAADPDADGYTTWQEWRCQTDPTNALSALRLLSATPVGTNVTVSWQSVAGVNYFLERSTNLASSPVFTPLATGIPGQGGTTTYTDTDAGRLAPLFYRVGVQ